MIEQYNKIPLIIKIATLLFFIGGLLTSYYIHISVAIVVLYLLFFLFWNDYHPPTILIGLIFLWLSITLGYFYVAFFHGNINELLWYPYYSADNIDKAYWYSIFGLASLGLGIKLGAGRSLQTKIDIKELGDLAGVKLIVFFIIYSFVADYLFDRLRFILPGISEFFNMLRFFKWSFLLLATMYVFQTRRNQVIYWLIISFGIISSFTSFFSDFKPYFFVIPIGYLTVRSLNLKQTIYLTFIVILVYLLGVYWSYIKEDYRFFLSGGAKGQQVVVSKTEALKKFFSYTKTFDKRRFRYGQEALLKRIFYLEFFSATIRNIPTYKPYMQGGNILRAIRHVTMPRLLFPDKPPLDDSRHTTELTGIYVTGAKQGVSISVGFFSELYADFGPWGLQVSLLILGLLIGLIYRITINISHSTLWGIALAFPIFFFVSSFEKDLVKLIGNILWFLITVFIIKFTVLKPIIIFFKKNHNDNDNDNVTI